MDRGADSLGSRKTSFNLLAGAPGSSGDLSKRVVVIKIEECTLNFLDQILGEQKAGAILFLLPENLDNVTESTISDWKLIEESLIEKEITVPVYFAVANEELQSLVSQISLRSGQGSSASEDFRLVVTAPEAVKVSSVSMTNFQVLYSFDPIFE